MRALKKSSHRFEKIIEEMFINLDIFSIFCNLAFVNKRVMLPNQGTIQFSEHSVLYDMLIPKNHLLRKINELIASSCCQGNDTGSKRRTRS